MTSGTWTLTVPNAMYADLLRHHFRGDHDEHGSVIVAGVSHAGETTRLLGRDLIPARDGVDYVAGDRGYRMLTAAFVRDAALRCRDNGYAYIAVHNHDGATRVGFSADDMASHERGYPALVSMMRGKPVGGLVLASGAAAGDLWLASGGRQDLDQMVVLGRPIRRLRPKPLQPHASDTGFDRQTRLLGDAGQAILAGMHVGVIGAGGVGSLLLEYLARLGVGRLTTADPDRLDATNVPRVVGSTQRDARPHPALPMRKPATRKRPTSKVSIARRVALQANPNCAFRAIHGDFLDPMVARVFLGCDYVFLAADTMSARLLFNAITQQYLLPGAQVGSKVDIERSTGTVIRAFSIVRPVSHDGGCLWCNGLIPPARLQLEALTDEQRTRQRYIDDPAVGVPSVITLNAVGAAIAANEFLFVVSGLARPSSHSSDYIRVDALTGEVFRDEPSRDTQCSECGLQSTSRRARGDGPMLPTTVHARASRRSRDGR